MKTSLQAAQEFTSSIDGKTLPDTAEYDALLAKAMDARVLEELRAIAKIHPQNAELHIRIQELERG